MVGYLSFFWSGHCDRHVEGDFLGGTDSVLEFSRRQVYGFGEELGDGECEKAGVVKLGVFLREYERFVSSAVFIDVRKECSCEEVAFSFGAESEPF